MSEVLSVQKIKKEFGERVLFSDVSFKLYDDKRLAIVGPNGCGKSTLLKIIAGEEEATDGVCVQAKDISLGYLAQYQDEDIDYSNIYEYVLSVRSEILETERRILELENILAVQSGEIDSVMDEYHALSDEYDRAGGKSYKSEVAGILKGLGFSENDFNKQMVELSGGQKTRVNLARLLVKKPDILLLDEPINHLDMSSIEWLESFLSTYRKGIVIVAHDRYFLDKVATDILDLSAERSKEYHGNYSEYISQRAIYKKALERTYEKQQKEIKHQEEVIAKLKQFNREKSIKRAESRQKLLDKKEIMDNPYENKKNMRISLEPDIISGKDVLSVKALSKSFEAKKLFSDISFEVQRNERVAIIGDNGCGKTTLLKIINEIIPQDEGNIRIGTNVQIAYFDQEQQNLTESNTLYEELSDSYPNLTETKIRNVLAAFLFTADDAYKLISELSGGERGRISLCKLMLSGANFLILDEPTNHLDMDSKEILANAIDSYDGTVLFVSHDRYFINQCATRILELSSKHGLVNYLGDYDYYLIKREQLHSSDNTDTTVKNESSSKDDWERQKEEAARLRKLENERIGLESEIERLEEELEAINEEFMNPDYSSNSAKLNELTLKSNDIKETLAKLYDKWEALV